MILDESGDEESIVSPIKSRNEFSDRENFSM